jgi:hypothetical protein
MLLMLTAPGMTLGVAPEVPRLPAKYNNLAGATISSAGAVSKPFAATAPEIQELIMSMFKVSHIMMDSPSSGLDSDHIMWFRPYEVVHHMFLHTSGLHISDRVMDWLAVQAVPVPMLYVWPTGTIKERGSGSAGLLYCFLCST